MAEETLKGTVAKAHKGQFSWGIQLEGRDGWLNATKKLSDAWPNVQAGDSVACQLWTSDTGKLYVSAISVMSKAAGGNGAKPEGGPGSYAFRDISISRQSSIKSALEFMRLEQEHARHEIAREKTIGSPPSVTVIRLLEIAEVIEAWILKAEDEPEPTAEEPDPEYTG